MTIDEKREMTVREAGRKGGEAVKRKYGSAYYSKIGRIGGGSSGKGSEGEKSSEAGDKTTAGGT